MDRQPRALWREEIAAYYLDRAIRMRRARLAGWARSAAGALASLLARPADLPPAFGSVAQPGDDHRN